MIFRRIEVVECFGGIIRVVVKRIGNAISVRIGLCIIRHRDVARID